MHFICLMQIFSMWNEIIALLMSYHRRNIFLKFYRISISFASHPILYSSTHAHKVTLRHIHSRPLSRTHTHTDTHIHVFNGLHIKYAKRYRNLECVSRTSLPGAQSTRRTSQPDVQLTSRFLAQNFWIRTIHTVMVAPPKHTVGYQWPKF